MTTRASQPSGYALGSSRCLTFSSGEPRQSPAAAAPTPPSRRPLAVDCEGRRGAGGTEVQRAVRRPAVGCPLVASLRRDRRHPWGSGAASTQRRPRARPSCHGPVPSPSRGLASFPSSSSSPSAGCRGRDHGHGGGHGRRGRSGGDANDRGRDPCDSSHGLRVLRVQVLSELAVAVGPCWFWVLGTGWCWEAVCVDTSHVLRDAEGTILPSVEASWWAVVGLQSSLLGEPSELPPPSTRNDRRYGSRKRKTEEVWVQTLISLHLSRPHTPHPVDIREGGSGH